MEIVKQYYNLLISPHSQDFMAGWYTGLAVALALILVLFFVYFVFNMIFSSHRCRHITIASADGDLEIAAEAITDLVKSIQPEFPNITFEKLKLYQRGSKQTVELLAAFNTSAGGMPEQFEVLKRRIRDVLRETFGINSIRKVSVHCHQVVIPAGEGPTAIQHRPMPDAGACSAESSQDSYKITFDHL